MEEPQFITAAESSVSERSTFLQQVALRTLGALCVTAVAAVLSMFLVAPAVFGMGTIAVLLCVYGGLFGAQFLGRKMVYGQAKVAGVVVGSSLQGLALGFLLLMAVATTAPGEGLQIIGYALLMMVLSVAAMLLYVSNEPRDFSMLRAGLAMAGIPMLVLMGLQFVIPAEGMLGLVVSGVFLLVSVGALLYRLNVVLREFPPYAATEAAFELSLGIVIFFWNLLSFLLRMRRR